MAHRSQSARHPGYYCSALCTRAPPLNAQSANAPRRFLRRRRRRRRRHKTHTSHIGMKEEVDALPIATVEVTGVGWHSILQLIETHLRVESSWKQAFLKASFN